LEIIFEKGKAIMNKRSLVFYGTIVVCALAAGIIMGTIFAPQAGLTRDRGDAASSYPIELSSPGAHVHSKAEVPAGVAPPSILLEVRPDPMKKRNYTLHLITENFRFAPEAVSTKPVFGEGHAHLYIDDTLIQRIYGPWHHVPALKPGRHVMYVTLNLNNHDEYAVSGKTIGAQAVVDAQ
jgi:hypothetical protein